jgi:hypothetical protein
MTQPYAAGKVGQCGKWRLATRPARSYLAAMVKITISAQAFAAIASTLPLGTVVVEPERAPDGSVGLWLDHATLAKLNRARGPGESYSDEIIALAEGARA